MDKQFLSIGDKVLMKDGRTLTVKSLEYHEFVSKEEIGYIPKKDIERNLTPLKPETAKAVGRDLQVMPKIAEVTRLVVVDHRGEEPIGRIIDTMPVKIETSLQDDNRTLKIFITKRG